MIKTLYAIVLLVLAQNYASAQDHPLSDTQIKALHAIKARAEKKAAPMALRLAATAGKIYDNMLSDREDSKLQKRLELELKKVAGDLLAIKGQSIREMVAVLTSDQKQEIKQEMKKPGVPGDLSELIVKYFNVPGK